MVSPIFKFNYDRDITFQGGNISIFNDQNVLQTTANVATVSSEITTTSITVDLNLLNAPFVPASNYTAVLDAGIVRENDNLQLFSLEQTIQFSTVDQPTVIESSIILDERTAYTLDNPNAFGTSAGDRFGWDVDISSNYVIVGAFAEDDAGGDGSGKAYIFDITTGALVYTLDNPNDFGTSTGDAFGISVAIHGNRAIVGAWQEDDPSSTASGRAYIYDLTTGNFLNDLQFIDFDIPNGSNNYFGRTVALTDTYAIVGAYGKDNAGILNSGKVYVHSLVSYSLIWTLDNPNAFGTEADDEFGSSLAAFGNYVIVGAYKEDYAGGNSSGRAYIFDLTTGALVHTLDNPNAFNLPVSDAFGWDVDISGNYAIVGAPLEDDASGLSSGKAYIFDLTTGALVHTLNNPNNFGTSAGDEFGRSVTISDSYAIVAASFEDDAGGTTSGKVYVYNVTTGNLLYTIDNPNPFGTTASDAFGQSVAIFNNKLVVGAHQEDDVGGTESGKAYVYNIVGVENGIASTFDSFIDKNAGQFDLYRMDQQLIPQLISTINVNSNLVIINNDIVTFNLSGLIEPGFFYYLLADEGTFVDAVYGFDSAQILDTEKIFFTIDSVINPGIFAISSSATTEASLNPIYQGAADIQSIVNVTGRYSVFIDPDFTLNNPNIETGIFDEFFGREVAIGDTYSIVSSRESAIFVYNNTTGALTYTLPTPSAAFGISIYQNLVLAYSSVNDSAYLFDLNGGTPTTPIQTFANPGVEADQFGNGFNRSTINNTYAVVAASGYNDGANTNSGRVYVFNRTTGALVRTITNPTPGIQDIFGVEVAMNNNNILAISGAYDDTNGTNAGRVYVYNVATGALLYTLNEPTPGAEQRFGFAIDIDLNELVVSAVGSGKVYIYSLSTGNLLNTIDDNLEAGFGYSVSIDGNYVAVGNPQASEAGLAESGKVYVYNITSPIQPAFTLDNPNAVGTVAGDRFGDSVDLSGNTLIVGAQREDETVSTTSNQGIAYIFKLDTI